MTDNCENRQSMNKWLCRLGNSLELQEDGSYALITNRIASHTFHETATSTGDGTPYSVGTMKTITLSITGQNISTAMVVFEGSDGDGNYTEIAGIKLSDYNISTKPTINIATPSEKWQVPVEGLINFRARISSLTGANASLTIKGVITS